MVYSTEQYHMKQKIVEVLVFKEVIDIFWKSQLPTITFFFFFMNFCGYQFPTKFNGTILFCLVLCFKLFLFLFFCLRICVPLISD